MRCSSGTYVRAIARDLGAALGVGGHLTALRRTAVGPFDLGRRPHPRRSSSDDVRADARSPTRPAPASRRSTSTSSRPPTSASAARSTLALPAAGPVAVFAPDGEFLALYEQAGERGPRGRGLHRLTGTGHRVGRVVRRAGLAIPRRGPGGPRPHRRRHRQLRRRPPRSPARDRPGPRASPTAAAHALVAVTFDPHPMAVLRPEHAPVDADHDRRPRRAARRGRRRRRAGAALLPRDRRLVAGGVRRPGPGRRAARRAPSSSAPTSASAAGPPATSRTLREAGAARGFVAEGIALDGGPQVWSSTYVRTCLAAGDVDGAAEALGRRSPCAAWSSRATGAAASSATRPPTCRSRPGSPRPPTACTPAG